HPCRQPRRRGGDRGAAGDAPVVAGTPRGARRAPGAAPGPGRAGATPHAERDPGHLVEPWSVRPAVAGHRGAIAVAGLAPGVAGRHAELVRAEPAGRPARWLRAGTAAHR